ncbi:MAG TPA: DUF4010 domain-containing protein [Candidatus Binatia bacterium]
MADVGGTVIGVGVAFGCGLLIGVERERRKGRGATRALAGVRTFALAALGGAIAQALRQPLLVAAGATLVLALSAVAYRNAAAIARRDGSRGGEAFDPGVTTELALFVTFLLGVMAIDHPAVAAGAAALVALVLAARTELHRFATMQLTAEELRDALLFAGAALVVLPLVPDEPIRWLAEVNPRRLWGLVVLLMALQGAGYVAVRSFGARLGLAVSGLVAGFVSSTATVGAMGARARAEPDLLRDCVSGAIFSNVATIVQLGAVAVAVHPPSLATLASSLGAGAVVAVAVAALSLRGPSSRRDVHRTPGHPFEVRAALLFATLLTGVTAAASFATRRYGAGALDVVAGLSGFADVHAAAASVMSLAAGNRIPEAAVLPPILLAFTTNAASKAVIAWTTGGRRYALRVGAGLLALSAAVWAPWVLRG